MIKQYIITILVFSIVLQQGIAQTTNKFTDPRDGKMYRTISFRSDSTGTIFTWMAQNLNYEMPGSYAYDDTMKYRKELGLLYAWEAARKACPPGWHLPTDNEWSILVNQFGGTDKAANALKSLAGWDHDGNGTNSSGFNGLAGGQRKPNDTANVLMGLIGFWWTSSPANMDGSAWGWNMHFGGHSSDKPLKLKVFRFPANVSHGSSVRCVCNLTKTIKS